MVESASPRTAPQNSRLWGARAADWSQIQEGQCRPAYLAVFDRLAPLRGLDYLDVGCGAGMAARIAAERGANVSGVDAAPALLEIARQRVPGANFREADLESLPFPAKSFDCVTGFNAFQYAGNPIAALHEAKRVARPGAKIVIMTWGPPEGMQAASLVTALRPLMPPPPPGAPGPFALSDERALRALAASAGLQPRDILDVDCPFAYPSLEQALTGLKSAGVAVRAIEATSEAAVDRAYTEALAPFRQSDGSYRALGSFRCLISGV